MGEREPEELRRQIESLLEQLGRTTEEEAMKQVARSMVLYLCYPCYSSWIDDPTGRRISA